MEDLDPDKDNGPAMQRLEPKRRNFVNALVEAGGGPRSVETAAVAAGYSPLHGWKLMRDQGVLAAFREEAEKKLTSGAIIGAKVIMEIAMDVSVKPSARLSAARMLLEHNGFMPMKEQKITVQHLDRSTQEMLDGVRVFAQQLGLDPRRLLGAAGVIDAEFEDVAPAEGEPWTA